MEIDASVLPRLTALFAECRELGVVIPGDMPLDTPEHQRAACHYLGRLIWEEKKRRDRP